MKQKKILSILIAVLAACLILFGTLGVTRAVLTTSGTYSGTLDTQSGDVAILENGNEVSNLLSGFTSFIVGKQYKEEIAVKNTGTMDEYVRVTLYRYWTNEKGEKITTLDPKNIQFVIGAGWVMDKSKTTDERVVLYYTKPLAVGKDTSATPAVTFISVSSDITKESKQTETKSADGQTSTITTTYTYDGLQMNLEASVDAVQTHHAADAILASWGANVTINESTGELSLN